jgi:pimeloyl-ACP methyl ester carboxylesterase
MRKLNIILFFSIFLFWINPVTGQEKIQYGSNDGQYISVQNTGIYYEAYGEGTPLLLFHGGLSSMSYFSMIIPELAKHFRVIAVDAPGHGRSYHADSMSYQLMSDYMSEMIDLMGLDSVYLLGCSMGSNVALVLAHDRPDKVKRIISDGGIINANGSKIDIIEYTESVSIETLSKRWINWYNSVNPQKDLLGKFILNSRSMGSELPILSGSKISSIKSRALIMMGDRDGMIKLEHGLELYRAIKGSEFCVIPGAGHCIGNEKPDLMNKIVIDFLTAR